MLISIALNFQEETVFLLADVKQFMFTNGSGLGPFERCLLSLSGLRNDLTVDFRAPSSFHAAE